MRSKYKLPIKMKNKLFFAMTASFFLSVNSLSVIAKSVDIQVEENISTKIYGNDNFIVPYRKAIPVSAPRARYPGFNAHTEILKKGTIRRSGAKPLPCDIRFERDVTLKMRDGTQIYTDIFRPVDHEKHPALVAWSPYGKEIGGQWLDDIAGRSGVPLENVSELQKFEGPDPAFWVCHGYSVLNPDPRGAYMSQGNITYWGRQLAEDGYDFIEWAAKQKWSSGKIGMAGNSWLAVSQWFIAAENPPHLSAIAPWEGFTDHFRDTGNRGGIPAPQFPEMIIQTFAGQHMVEDQPRMIVSHQLFDSYWQDKKARLDRIHIPAYVVASYTNPAHTHGSFDGYRHIASKNKWLRVNNTNEWQDFYTPKYELDLLRFFDFYLKGIDNGWLKTPPVRLSVLDTTGSDVVDRPEQNWPLQRTQFTKLYLSNTHQLNLIRPNKAETVSYSVNQEGKTEFIYSFNKDTEVTGYMNLHLWVEAKGSDDMELAVSVEKLDQRGQPTYRLLGEGVKGSVTAVGLLRVSQRALNVKLSTPSEPFLLNTHEQKLREHDIVPVNIGIWPMGMKYHTGEKLKLTVAAYRPIPNVDLGFGAAKIPVPVSVSTFEKDEHVPLKLLGGKADISPAYVKELETPVPQSRNKGLHVLHMGGTYDSYLLIPEISGQ
jgi:predicted acyl esterase